MHERSIKVSSLYPRQIIILILSSTTAVPTCVIPPRDNDDFGDCTEGMQVDVGTQCTLSCDAWFSASVSTVTCTASGLWDQLPECTGISYNVFFIMMMFMLLL